MPKKKRKRKPATPKKRKTKNPALRKIEEIKEFIHEEKRRVTEDQKIFQEDSYKRFFDGKLLIITAIQNIINRKG
jgi:intein-encoded DNA endonuclease-like protein